MLALIAAFLFVIAFFIRDTHTAVVVWLQPTSLLIAGLALLALHLGGAGGWRIRRKR